VLLPADAVGLAQLAEHFGVHFSMGLNAEAMDVVARGERLDLREAGISRVVAPGSRRRQFQRKEHSPFNRLTVNRNACVTGEKSSNAKPVEKLRMVGHHYGCGAERESIQGLVEKERARKHNCPHGQAKAGRNTAKRGERN
jgi:hypothetical protein